jgi:hypothetical protein
MLYIVFGWYGNVFFGRAGGREQGAESKEQGGLVSGEDKLRMWKTTNGELCFWNLLGIGY